MADGISYPTAEETRKVLEDLLQIWTNDTKLQGKWVAFVFEGNPVLKVIASAANPQELKQLKEVLEAQKSNTMTGFTYVPGPEEKNDFLVGG